MFKSKTFLALIPARSGSVRLPRKNLLNLSGKPLIAWSIETALKSKYIDRIVVSTDDPEIAETSKRFGADVPFLRPPELATNDAKSIDVVIHALRYLETKLERFDYLLLLQPTSPMRTADHIDSAVEFLSEARIDAVIGVTEVDHPTEWTNILPSDLSMDKFFDRNWIERCSQDLPTRYRINGALYLCNCERILKEKSMFFRNNVKAFVMDRAASVDIDTQFDLTIAQYLLSEISD